MTNEKVNRAPESARIVVDAHECDYSSPALGGRGCPNPEICTKERECLGLNWPDVIDRLSGHLGDGGTLADLLEPNREANGGE